jgi:hypothetical protein
MRPILIAVLLATSATSVWAEEPVEEKETVAEEASQTESGDQETDNQEPSNEKPNGNGVDSPKTMSGMSILGNEEAPKSLVIIPWKSSRLGDEISLSDTLDDRAQPVDKDVLLRELRFHEIRSGEQT